MLSANSTTHRCDKAMGELCFIGARKQDVFAQAPMDGFTAAEKAKLARRHATKSGSGSSHV